jgi:hypothetical protein
MENVYRLEILFFVYTDVQCPNMLGECPLGASTQRRGYFDCRFDLSLVLFHDTPAMCMFCRAAAIQIGKMKNVYRLEILFFVYTDVQCPNMLAPLGRPCSEGAPRSVGYFDCRFEQAAGPFSRYACDVCVL